MDRKTLARALAMIAAGNSCNQTAADLGLANATLSRWVKRVEDCGGDVDEALEKRAGGRPVAFAPSEYETSLARWFRLAKESLPVAAYFFARDERVRPEIRQVVLEIEERALAGGRREEWPPSVRRAFRVTREELAAFRGKKASQQTEMITRRGMYEVLADGTEREILNGETWELDDYSANQPYVFRDPGTGEMLLGRQVLGARDLASARWLGFDHIGRERDAYRGEDILRFIGRLALAWGLPRRLRLERGSWESSAVHGIEIEGLRGRWGDLRDLMMIDHVFKSKSKSIIEGGFNVLQRWLAQTGADIGRRRGEYEEAARRLRAARAAGANPLELGFLSQERSSELHEEAARIINSRPMMREHLGERVAADDLVARHGWATHPLRAEDGWYFLPAKMLRTVRAGTVEAAAGGGWPKITVAVNGIREGVHFENGHQVLVAFDPARPELGAYIANGDRSARNREGWGMGEGLLSAAPVLGLAPQFSAAAQLSPHLLIRKKATAAAATSFRAIRGAAGTVQPAATHERAMMDGAGATCRAGDLPSVAAAAADEEEAAPALRTNAVAAAAGPERNSAPPISSRAVPADAAAEIERLTAALMGD